MSESKWNRDRLAEVLAITVAAWIVVASIVVGTVLIYRWLF